MKRLILDYFRRWWWVLALGALSEFWMGWSIPGEPKHNFEFWGLLIALWTGANLLQQDFQRGLARAMATLPLTSRQIGRSWWLATVAIPAAGMAALVFAGAGAFYFFNRTADFPVNRLAIACLFNLLWLGTLAAAIFTARITHLDRGYWLKLLGMGFIGGLSAITILGGMIYLQDASKHSFKTALFIGVGGFLTVASWFRAESFYLGRVNVGRVPVPIARPTVTPGPIRFGGIPFLLSTTFTRTFLTSLTLSALILLFMALQGHAMSGHAADMFVGQMTLFIPFWLMIWQLMSFTSQLRYFRTLPISTNALAAILLTINILPFLAINVVAATVFGLFLGTSEATVVLPYFLWSLVPCALASCVFLAFGFERQAYFLLFLTMMGVIIALKTLLRVASLDCSIVLVLAVILTSYLLTRHFIRHGSRAYRPNNLHTTIFSNAVRY